MTTVVRLVPMHALMGPEILIGLILGAAAQDGVTAEGLQAGDRDPLPPRIVDEQLATRFYPQLRAGRNHVYDPELHLRQRGSLRYWRRFDEHPDGGWTVRTNGQGMWRSAEVPAASPHPRILVLGDEHTRGAVPNESAFPSLLEAELSRARPGKTLEVLNAAVAGHGFHNYLAALDAHASLEPDLLVVAVNGGNDFSRSVRLHRRLKRHPAPVVSTSRRESLEERFGHAANIHSAELSQVIYFLDNPEDVGDSIELVIALTAELLERCEEAGVRLVCLYVPPPLRGQPRSMEGKGFPEPVAWQVSSREHRDRWTALIEDGDHEAFTERYRASLEEDPKQPEYAWAEREDVWVDFLGERGNLRVGYGRPERCFGPELGFGHVVGEALDAQVLLVKTAWGGKSLHRDFLPPSAPQPTDEELASMAEQENERRRRHNEKHPDRPRPMVTAKEIEASYGHYYREMLRHVRRALDDLDAFEGYRGQGHELAGFVWFQGWNDQFDERAPAEYGANLEHLVRDVRRDLDAPDLPFVVGVVGFDGPHDEPRRNGKDTPRTRIKAGQRAAAEAFPDTVTAVETAPYWDMEADAIYRGPGGWSADPERWRRFGNDRPYHYLGSPWFFWRAGEGFGEAMVRLLGD